MGSTSHSTEAQILERMLDPRSSTLDPSLARYLLSLNFKPEDHRRMNELTSKSQDGALSNDEIQELDSYLNLGHFLALLQSKARISLQNSNGVA